MTNNEMMELASQWWPSGAAVIVFGIAWWIGGLVCAECFSVGFVLASLLIAAEIGARKLKARARASQSQPKEGE